MVKPLEEASLPKTKSMNIDVNKNSLMMPSLAGTFKKVLVSPKIQRAKYSTGKDWTQ